MLPAKLKDFILFNDAQSYVGEVSELTLPKLTRKMEGWRGGGMQGEVKVDMGQDPLDLEFTIGGLGLQVLRQFGSTDIAGIGLRFMGAYQREDGTPPYAVEVIVRGRHEEIDMGTQKAGGDTETKVKTTCSYYKLVVDGETLVEIDMLGLVYVVSGVDRFAAIRAALDLI